MRGGPKQDFGAADVFRSCSGGVCLHCYLNGTSGPARRLQEAETVLGGQRHHLHPKHMTGCQTEVKSGQVHSGQPGSQYAAREEELRSAPLCAVSRFHSELLLPSSHAGGRDQILLK